MSKLPLTRKRLPPNERLMSIWQQLGLKKPQRFSDLRSIVAWETPTVTEVTHLNFHGLLDLLLALPLTTAELESVGEVISFYEMIDHVWTFLELPSLSKAEMALFPFTDITEHEHHFCNELLKIRNQIRVDWLRWLAVRDAYWLANTDRKTMSWQGTRVAASQRLKGTYAAGSPGTMKRSYDWVQRTLRNR